MNLIGTLRCVPCQLDHDAITTASYLLDGVSMCRNHLRVLTDPPTAVPDPAAPDPASPAPLPRLPKDEWPFQ